MALSLDSLRVTARTLRKQPVFTTVVILSLALAIALNTTMYGVLDAMTHPTLDMRVPARLYWIKFFGDYRGRVDTRSRDAALASGMHSYDAITKTDGGGFSGSVLLERGQNVLEGSTERVGENYFDVVGPRVLAGRTFLPADLGAAVSPVVINEDLAARLFPNSENPVGGSIEIDRVPHTVIGVISRASDFPHSRTAAWVLAPNKDDGMFIRLIRLRAGARRIDAERELDVIAARIAAASGEDPKSVAFRFHAAADPEFQVRGFHYALVLAVVAVLLVACANLANLQLARGISRRRDLALRAALGATRRRLVTHVLGESSLLAIGGLATGLLVAYLGGRVLTAFIPPSMGEYVAEPHMSWRVLLFALGATILCLVLIGLAPAVYVSRADPNELLKSGAGTGATKRNRQRYGILVAVEMALALALSSAAALSVRSAVAANQIAYGFDATPLSAGSFSYDVTPGAVLTYSELFEHVVSRVRAVDGVVAAAAFTGRGVHNNALTIEDPGGVREFPVAGYPVMYVSPSYLRTFRLPIIRGRDFRDGERDEGAVIVDEQSARVLWPNANPVGAQIKLGDFKSNLPFVHVVGVVGQQPGFGRDTANGVFMRNVRNLGRMYYLPGPSDTVVADGPRAGAGFVARADRNPEKLPVMLRQSFQAGHDVYARRISTLNDQLGLTRSRQSTRFVSMLFTLFGVLGVALAAFGVYGVVAHSVVERRRELGVRIALGATARDILHAVLRESTVVALAGIAAGLFITKYAKPYLSSLTSMEDDLYNAPLFAAVAVVLALATIVAAMIPAMRATRVDPTESLRNE